MATLDFHNSERRINNLLKRLDKSKSVSSHNKELIKDYYTELNINKKFKKETTRRRLSLVHVLCQCAGKKDFEKLTRKELLGIEKQIDGRNVSDSTKVMYNVAMKEFYTWANSLNDKVVDVSWINTRREERKAVDRSKFLTPKEFDKLLKVANTRDKAMLMMLRERGLRIQELANIKLRDIKFTDKGAVVKVNRLKRRGKTVEQNICFAHAEPYISRWIEVHPKNEDKDYWLFCSSDPRTKYAAPKYETLKRQLRRLKEKAGINAKKRIHFHLLRHMAMSDFADMGLSDSDLRHFGGWSEGSDMIKVYIHRNQEELENKYLELIGKKIKSIKCPRCKTKNEVKAGRCINCGLEWNEKDGSISAQELNTHETLSLFLQDGEFQKGLIELMAQTMAKKRAKA